MVHFKAEDSALGGRAGHTIGLTEVSDNYAFNGISKSMTIGTEHGTTKSKTRSAWIGYLINHYSNPHQKPINQNIVPDGVESRS
jgi:hypothetical protein